ncbi:MAG: hypothetical protein EBR63_04070, partial [Actinobacteria bacterium]|nr:hypothetical protein [Actinomycetota bacterium]
SVLSGGKIYTYAAGTTTPRTTYTSSSGLMANANPIILDSDGRLPNDLWLTSGLTYRLVLKDSTDVQIGSYDDIPGINDGALLSVPFSSITAKPTSLAGYGITDGVTSATAAATYAPIASPTFTGTPQIPDNAATSTNHPVGYREAPRNAQSGNYTLVLADRGKSVVMGDGTATAITATIPANSSVAFPIGTVIIFVNLNTVGLSIAITTDTLTLANSTTTGTRTLARNGLATCVKINTTSWLISGAGLT